MIERGANSLTPPIPENGSALVICAIFASDSGRIAGSLRPPFETSPSTLSWNSSVSGSISGIDANVFDETIASAPEKRRASSAMSVVDEVNFA